MPRAYSVELHARSLRALTYGMPAAEVTRLFDVSIFSLYRWLPRKDVGARLIQGARPNDRGRGGRGGGSFAGLGGGASRCHPGQTLRAVGLPISVLLMLTR